MVLFQLGSDLVRHCGVGCEVGVCDLGVEADHQLQLVWSDRREGLDHLIGAPRSGAVCRRHNV
jgi:hypothetical protein